jgi:putative solute:sodium symporter small subunit
MSRGELDAYWKSNLRYVAGILVAWASVSLGAAVLLVDALDGVRLFGFPVGFWFGQQGAILAFVALVWIHVALMNALDRRYGLYER